MRRLAFLLHLSLQRDFEAFIRCAKEFSFFLMSGFVLCDLSWDWAVFLQQSQKGLDMTMVSRIQKTRLAICAVIAVLFSANLSDARADVFAETFSGAGPYSSSSGVPGFENTGWATSGNFGSFITNNNFGEQVYSISADPGDGLSGVFRTLGTGEFEIIAEFSNLQLDQISTFGVQIADSPNVVGFNVIEQSSGEFTTSFAATVGGQNYFPGNISLGNNVEQLTFRILAQEDTVNGGSMFDFWIDVNESGVYQHVGSIDGTIYSIAPSEFRTVFLGGFPFSGDFYGEIDNLSISSVPEPATFSMVAIGLIGIAIRRRRK
jgi:hypothetical protein